MSTTLHSELGIPLVEYYLALWAEDLSIHAIENFVDMATAPNVPLGASPVTLGLIPDPYVEKIDLTLYMTIDDFDVVMRAIEDTVNRMRCSIPYDNDRLELIKRLQIAVGCVPYDSPGPRLRLPTPPPANPYDDSGYL